MENRKIIVREEHEDRWGHWFKIKFKDNGWGDENGVVDTCQSENAVKQYIKTGDIVEINNVIYKIKSVETFMSCRVWTAGIIVEKQQQDDRE